MASVMILLLLLWQPILASEGAKSGLILWSQTVLPTLLPFMICSNVIVALDGIHLLTFPFRPFLHRILKLSDSGSYVFLSGILCGYPMGAKTCNEFLEDGRISNKEASYLLSICNHPSPMFLMGYVISRLSGQVSATLLLLCLYLPLIPISALARRFYGVDRRCTSNPCASHSSLSFDHTMMSSIEVMVKIGGYIMLFSMLAHYIMLLPVRQPITRACLLGIAEITTGIGALANCNPGYQQLLAVVAITAFGGLSGIFQTKSVLKNAGLFIRHYIIWKLIHSLLSCLVFILLWH